MLPVIAFRVRRSLPCKTRTPLSRKGRGALRHVSAQMRWDTTTGLPVLWSLNIPILGIKMPIMGTKATNRVTKVRKGISLADALFSNIQQRVLAYVFGQPERSFFATELIKLAGGGSGAVQRELARLADSGLVTVSRVGTQKHYQANPKAPIFSELCAIAQKTVGLAEPLRSALKPLAKRTAAAFVYGSVAKKQDTAASDIIRARSVTALGSLPRSFRLRRRISFCWTGPDFPRSDRRWLERRP